MGIEEVRLADLPHRTRAEVIIDGARIDRAKTSALHLLAHRTLLRDPRVWRHVYARRTSHLEVITLARFDWPAMLDEPAWDHRGKVLVRIAADLNLHAPVRLSPISGFIPPDRARVMAALDLRYGTASWPAANDVEIRQVCAELAERGAA